MQAGDFKTNVLPIINKLLRLACQILQDEEEAKDVVQDVFLKLWQKRDELGKVDNLEAFAMRMTRNRCLDVIRSKQFRGARFNVGDAPPCGSNGDADHFENVDSANLVKQIIAKLPDIQRTVIHLRDIELLEFEEIAEVTQLEINAIRVNLSRARKKVRDEVLKIHSYGITEN
jgi:RNA polymerase sigma factor (sigma-70 family)